MSGAKITIDDGRGNRSVVEVGEGIKLGRTPGNDVQLDDQTVSRQHVAITLEEDGGYCLRDLGSANGTVLNGRRIIAPARLHNGDIIIVGSASMRFAHDAPVSRPDPTPTAGAATTLKARESAKVLIGSSPPMQRVFELIEKAAQSTIPVLVHGETGTGKELVARAVHEASDRAKRPFVAINCAALPETLLESELFGHRRGAFTGADRDRAGLFAEASGGTVFLDEIGEMPAGMQAKLLRVLQEGQIIRLGETKAIDVDFRLISATNRDLLRESDSGSFRTDLFYRVAALTISLPPLRERKEDIPAIVQMLLASSSRKQGKRIRSVEPSAMAALARFSWRGNVRELQNEIERAVTLIDDGGSIRIEDLSEKIIDGDGASLPGPSRTETETQSGDLRTRTEQFECREIQNALDRHGGNKTHAAKDLGVTYQGLLKKMRRLKMID